LDAALPVLPEDDALPEHPYKQWIIIPRDPDDEYRCLAWAWEIHSCLEPEFRRPILRSIVWRWMSAFQFLNLGVDPDCQLPHKDFFFMRLLVNGLSGWVVLNIDTGLDFGQDM
jgi:hypothetical protein